MRQLIQKIKLPTKKSVTNSQKATPWTFGNKVLYNLCRRNFTHKSPDIILAKVLLIGRSYSVALDRNKNKRKKKGDNFYLKTVVPKFKNMKIDSHLAELIRYKKITDKNIPEILKLHQYLLKKLNTITKHDKRSFSSKYLHFHLPHLFYIYDSRVVSAIRKYVSRLPSNLQKLANNKNIDKNYAVFFYKCHCLRKEINRSYLKKITPRQLDNLLLKTPILKGSENDYLLN